MSASPERKNVATDLMQDLVRADFVQVHVAQTATAILAAGLLQRGLAELAKPYHLMIGNSGCTPDDSSLVIRVGPIPHVDADIGVHPAELVQLLHDFDRFDLTDSPAWIRETANRVIFERPVSGSDRPVIGIPIEEQTDGVAHSTLIHGPFSADEDRTASLLEPHESDLTAVRSALTLELLSNSPVTGETAEKIEVFLTSTETNGPFHTTGGVLDVLTVLSQTAPGVALSTICGWQDIETATESWRTTAIEIHDAIRGERRTAGDVTIIDSSTPAVASVSALAATFTETTSVVLADNGGRIGISGMKADDVAQVDGIEAIIQHLPNALTVIGDVSPETIVSIAEVEAP